MYLHDCLRARRVIPELPEPPKTAVEGSFWCLWVCYISN
jgi:hypothetical protein